MASALTAQIKAIKCSCSNCGQHIEVPADREGTKLQCPTCKGEFTVPNATKPKVRADCPRCAQRLKVPPESAGTEIECPICTHTFKVPVPPEERTKLRLPHLPQVPRWLLPVLGSIVLLCGLVSHQMWRNRPEYALRQIGRAIKQHDFAVFQEYVDIDSVATRLIDDLTVLGLTETGDGSGESALGAGLVQLLKPRLTDEVKKQLSRFVEQGDFETSSALAKPFAGLGESGSYLGVVHTKRDGRIAVVGLGFTNKTERSSRIVEVKLRKARRGWQVAELSNVKDLVRQGGAEAAERLARHNEPIRAEINKVIKVVGFTKENGSDRYGIAKHVLIGVSLMNTGHVPIRGYRANVRVKGRRGLVRVQSNETIQPGGTGSGSWKYEINEFLPFDVEFYKAPFNSTEFELVRVTLQEGRELVIAE